ncbi:methyltransferase-like protein 9 [Nilaparvata lugens]|uniref:methyltransferase-like protein 9 n=1 Tax=Nilaparvata lugens TaxID=108931 RepID=UPI00193D2754|nr:methyltransferase-like protein 9 [Nilaparvata lugens]
MASAATCWYESTNQHPSYNVRVCCDQVLDSSSCSTELYNCSTDSAACCGQLYNCSREPAWRMYRPRGALSRALYDRYILDQELKDFNKDYWYKCSMERLLPEVRGKFVQSSFDRETEHFLQSCEKKSDQIFLQLWYSLAKTLLSLFMSHTNINGLLGRGSMFVVSSEQFGSLLGRRRFGTDEGGTSLLDLGAGDGNVTRVMAEYYSQVYVTEVAATMRWKLARKGFSVLEIDGWQESKYDTISCLNLLDRCEYPLSILEQLKQSLRPNGQIVIALVLPYKPYVESGGSCDHKPRQFLPVSGSSFEEQVNSLVRDVLEPMGFTVERWTRLPYLCEGDLSQSYYWLNDAVFVLRVAS